MTESQICDELFSGLPREVKWRLVISRPVTLEMFEKRLREVSLRMEFEEKWGLSAEWNLPVSESQSQMWQKMQTVSSVPANVPVNHNSCSAYQTAPRKQQVVSAQFPR